MRRLTSTHLDNTRYGHSAVGHFITEDGALVRVFACARILGAATEHEHARFEPACPSFECLLALLDDLCSNEKSCVSRLFFSSQRRREMSTILTLLPFKHLKSIKLDERNNTSAQPDNYACFQELKSGIHTIETQKKSSLEGVEQLGSLDSLSSAILSVSSINKKKPREWGFLKHIA